MKQKKIYETPVIVPHSVGLMNKFGRTSACMPADTVDGISAAELVHKYGSPLYVVSEETLRRKYREMFRNFSLRYPKFVIAYSYKTNYLSGICAALHQEGAWAEVVSGFEYEIALSLGVPGEKIIFNGPLKRKEELVKAIKNNSKINIDSYEELNSLEHIAREMNTVAETGVRVNAEVNYPPWDRFGFNIETGQAFEVCKMVASSKHLKLKGLHIHCGTYITDLNIYSTMISKLMNFCKLLKDEMDVDLSYLDIGGGYASMNSLHSNWLPPEQICPTFEQYAEIICPAVLRGPFKPQNMPLLICEPGRAIVDEAMHLLVTVISVKKLSNGGKAIVVDGGVNLLPTCYWYRFNISSLKSSSYLPNETVDIYGPMCMQIDVLRHGVSLPPLKQGDLLMIKNVGAYNFSQSMQFIQPRPAIVLINNGNVEYLRMPEDTNYIKQLERVPEHLIVRGE